MKKYGFTLAEVMVALGIITVAAIVAAPAVSDMMPQKDKLKVIRYATQIDDATNELLNDRSMYHATTYTGLTFDEYGRASLANNFDNSKVGESECIGLECTQLPENKEILEDESYNAVKYSGVSKYRTLLSRQLGLKNGMHPDGSRWTIEPGIPARVSIDINGMKAGKNCHFPYSNTDVSACSDKPDTFVFVIDRNGTVMGDDPLTKAYLANPLNMHDKKKDFSIAKEALKNKTTPPKK